jgi:hypothetical protein
MKKLLAIIVLGLLFSGNGYAKVINPYNLDMKGYWEKRNGIKFPNKIACKTQQVVNCEFKEKDCGPGVNKFPAKWEIGNIILDFKNGKSMLGKNEGTITYLGGLTYHIKAKKYVKQAGQTITFVQDHSENQLNMIWEFPYQFGNTIQAHSGFCLIVDQ